MSEHEKIRELLPLAGSGDISPEEMRLVREHLTRCDACARVSEDFVALGSALRGLPTPLPRAELVTRVRELAEIRLVRKHSWSRDAVVLAPLVAAGWIMALVTWPLVRAAGIRMFTGWHVPGGGFGTALAFYSILGLLLACISAFAVGKHANTIGRT
jgi:anti-sigma factor RsiW